jgi:hypothetical protein
VKNTQIGSSFWGGQTVLTSLATLHVFVYEYDDENKVLLAGGHYWEACSIDGAISLHIITTSLLPENPLHERDTEIALGQVISNYPGLLLNNFPDSRPPCWDETDNPLYGGAELMAAGLVATRDRIVTTQGEFAFSQAEMEEIIARTARIGMLGRMKQSGTPLSLAWHDAGPVCDVVTNCWALEV